MDAIGWYIATMHALLGHDAASDALGQDRGDKTKCVICRYEQQLTADSEQAVNEALRPRTEVLPDVGSNPS